MCLKIEGSLLLGAVLAGSSHQTYQIGILKVKGEKEQN